MYVNNKNKNVRACKKVGCSCNFEKFAKDNCRYNFGPPCIVNLSPITSVTSYKCLWI